jgi:ribosome-associated heat shock protein Hsp15
MPPGAKRYHSSMATGVRVDSWVWAVRLTKTRSAATTACRAGHVRINDQTAKAAQHVVVGDIVRVRLHGFDKIYQVVSFATRRGSAVEAAKHFEDLTPPPLPREERAILPQRDRGAGRPSKRERRELDELRGHDSSLG